jgi:hypothetical protein
VVKKKVEIDRKNIIKPTVELVVGILGAAALVGAVVILPATPVVITPILKFLAKKNQENQELKNHKFDKVRLWILLRRLEKQKDVRFITDKDGSIQVELTEKGKVKHLKYKLDDLGSNFGTKSWDGKWRLIFFDVPETRRGGRDNFRRILKSLKFYPLQKSVYLTPYSCQDEIEYLRSYFGLGNQVQILVSDRIENDEAYKLYFGLM